MKKRYFILLGRSGIVYYSWLFIVLFIGLIFAYEGANGINWLAGIILTVFILLLGYTVLNSYWHNNYFKIPYRMKIKLDKEPQIIKSWGIFKLYQVNISQLQTFYLLRITK